ncbi:hypothetical protein WDK08_03355 [Escherichia coli]
MSNVGSRSHVVCKNVLRLAGELSIVRVLNDFQPLPILLCFSRTLRHTNLCTGLQDFVLFDRG